MEDVFEEGEAFKTTNKTDPFQAVFENVFIRIRLCDHIFLAKHIIQRDRIQKIAGGALLHGFKICPAVDQSIQIDHSAVRDKVTHQAAAGHANPRVVRAGQKQMATLLHATGQRDAAAAMIERWLSETDRIDDPWWSYWGGRSRLWDAYIADVRSEIR